MSFRYEKLKFGMDLELGFSPKYVSFRLTIKSNEIIIYI